MRRPSHAVEHFHSKQIDPCQHLCRARLPQSIPFCGSTMSCVFACVCVCVRVPLCVCACVFVNGRASE